MYQRYLCDGKSAVKKSLILKCNIHVHFKQVTCNTWHKTMGSVFTEKNSTGVNVPRLRLILLHFSLSQLTKVHYQLLSLMLALSSQKQLLQRILYHPAAALFLPCFCLLCLLVDVPHFHGKPKKNNKSVQYNVTNMYVLFYNCNFLFKFVVKIWFWKSTEWCFLKKLLTK